MLRIKYQEEKEYIYLFFYIFFAILLYTSPLLGFYGGSAFLALSNFKLIERLPICILIIISGSLIYSSRMLGFVGGDDFYNEYYPLFQDISIGQSIFDSKFGGGIEFGLSLYFKILIELGVKNASTVLFSTTLTILSLFYIFVEGFLVKQVRKEDRCIFLSSIFIFLGLMITTQLLRQAFSSVFVLFSLWAVYENKKLLSFFILMVGVLFHITAVPIFIIFYIIMFASKRKKITLSICFLFFGFFFGLIVKHIAGGGIIWAIQSKFLYYADNTQNGFQTAYYWRHLIVIGIMSYLFNSKESKASIFYGLSTYSVIIYFSLISIPFASDRIMMPMTTFLLGGLVYFSFIKYKAILKYMLIVYSLFRFIQLGPLYDIKCKSGVFCLWHTYNWLGSIFIN